VLSIVVFVSSCGLHFSGKKIIILVKNLCSFYNYELLASSDSIKKTQQQANSISLAAIVESLITIVKLSVGVIILTFTILALIGFALSLSDTIIRRVVQLQFLKSAAGNNSHLRPQLSILPQHPGSHTVTVNGVTSNTKLMKPDKRARGSRRPLEDMLEQICTVSIHHLNVVVLPRAAT
jgi:hypothetical protein